MTVKGLLDFLASTEQTIPVQYFPIVRIINSGNQRFKPIYYIVGVNYEDNKIIMYPKFTGPAYNEKDKYLYIPETTRERLIGLLTDTDIKPLEMDKKLQWYSGKGDVFFDVAGISFDKEKNQIIIDLIEV